MQQHPIGIVGASGYSGIEATRILAGHPLVRIAFLTSDRWAGRTAREMAGIRGEAADLPYVSPDEAAKLAEECAAVLLATPAEVSIRLAPSLLEAGAKVIDLSGAFRLRDPAVFSRAYGFEHAATTLLDEAAYGLPELFRDGLAGRRLVANPGCYPTAVTLALAPLLGFGLVDPASVVTNALSGASGAGRRASEAFSFCEVADDVRAYRIFDHQHVPEIRQILGGVAGTEVPLIFTPHLLPIRRGILATTFARLTRPSSQDEIREVFQAAYAREPFVDLVDSAAEVSLGAVVGTNRCRIGFSLEGDRLLLCSAIDNLVKGAAGQAVQNLNLLMGWDETLGLSSLRGSFP